MDGSSAMMVVVLERALKEMAAVSKLYGSGELYADFMMVVFITALILLVMMLIFSPRSSRAAEKVNDDYQYHDLGTLISEIRAEVRRSLSTNRAEMEFVKHELLLIREQLRCLSDSKGAVQNDLRPQRVDNDLIRMDRAKRA